MVNQDGDRTILWRARLCCIIMLSEVLLESYHEIIQPIHQDITASICVNLSFIPSRGDWMMLNKLNKSENMILAIFSGQSSQKKKDYVVSKI